jgi:23S rRNA (guanosine2251-2'-O)-methyltransferase
MAYKSDRRGGSGARDDRKDWGRGEKSQGRRSGGRGGYSSDSEKKYETRKSGDRKFPGSKSGDRKYGRDKSWSGKSGDAMHGKTRTQTEPGRAAEKREEDPNRIEGRNAVLEAFRSGRSVDKLYVQADLHDGVVSSITRQAREAGTVVSYVPKNRLDAMSETGSHQGVIAEAAAVNYVDVDDILKRAEEKGEKPFLFLLDGIEDPHNLGAIIRTANLAGAHGVIITRHRAVGLSAVVAKASAGAINYTPVARVTNMAATIAELKKKGIWFVCGAMDGTPMYDVDMTGPVGIVIGNEGEGVSRLVRESCDYTASIPMHGDIDSLNASVAAGVLAFEVVRQRIVSSK